MQQDPQREPLHPSIPRRMFLTRGIGRARRKLTSFEFALRDAGIERCNLVRVSSIFPPHCRLMDAAEGIELLPTGGITHCVLSDIATDEPGRLVAASIGLAVPGDPEGYGYLSEHESFGETAEEAGATAEHLAASMLASTLGVEYDPSAHWDEEQEMLEIRGGTYRTRNVTAAAAGSAQGGWTTVLAAAVFVA